MPHSALPGTALGGGCFRSAMWIPLAGNLCGRNLLLKLGGVGHRMTFLLQLVVAEGPRTDFLLTSSGQNFASFLIPTNFYLCFLFTFLHFSLSLFSFFFPIG